MKRILLSSAAIFAFAGAAFAEGHTGLTFTGSAELGYNDEEIGDNDGFYSDLDIEIGFAAELDNGIMVGASIGFEDLADGQGADASTGRRTDYDLFISTENASLNYGDTSLAADNIWIAAGDMEADDFSSADGEEVLRGSVTVGNVSGQLSYLLANSDGDQNVEDDLAQLSLGVTATYGNYNFIAAYQEEFSDAADAALYAGSDIEDNEVFGLSVATTIAAANVRLAYVTNETNNEESIGLEVAYPFGPVVATVYYVSESGGADEDDNYGFDLAYEQGPLGITFDYDNDQDVDIYGLEGSYDVGNGLVVHAGYIFFEDLASEDAFYVGGEYDLGGGAELLVSYAEGDDVEYDDEIGNQAYQEGTTIELSFEF